MRKARYEWCEYCREHYRTNSTCENCRDKDRYELAAICAKKLRQDKATYKSIPRTLSCKFAFEDSEISYAMREIKRS